MPAADRSPSTSTTISRHTPPKRPGAYLRISSDRFRLEAGVDRQLEDAEDTRARLHWGPFAKIYRENDTSAFKKRKVIKPDGSIDWIVLRPEFRQLLADLATGVIDGVIFYDLDRLVRQPRDLEDLIDIVEYVKRPVTGATGGRMNLINDSDRHMARMMCVMALKSSEDTARRVTRQHLSAAQNGIAQGRIAYGWARKGDHKGQLVPDEADIVVRIFQDFMSGESAYSIARTFNTEGIKPPAAAPGHPRWSPRCSATPAMQAWSPTQGNIVSKPLLPGTAGPWSSSMIRDARCSVPGNPSLPPSSGPRFSSSGNAAVRRRESNWASPARRQSTSTFSPESYGAANVTEAWWDTATDVSQER
ncbi:recombinase family protein [Streptomyces lydicus]|nr:recombinase family protein [Streptomyces lydicus]